MTNLSATITRLREDADKCRNAGWDGSCAPHLNIKLEDLTALLDALEGKAEPTLIAEIDAAILGLNRLTGAGEDFIWRPAEKARKALIAAREVLGGPVSACIHCGGPLETGPRGFTDCPACNPNPARE